jgi:hypothetical protein
MFQPWDGKEAMLLVSKTRIAADDWHMPCGHFAPGWLTLRPTQALAGSF